MCFQKRGRNGSKSCKIVTKLNLHKRNQSWIDWNFKFEHLLKSFLYVEVSLAPTACPVNEIKLVRPTQLGVNPRFHFMIEQLAVGSKSASHYLLHFIRLQELSSGAIIWLSCLHCSVHLRIMISGACGHQSFQPQPPIGPWTTDAPKFKRTG